METLVLYIAMIGVFTGSLICRYDGGVLDAVVLGMVHVSKAHKG